MPLGPMNLDWWSRRSYIGKLNLLKDWTSERGFTVSVANEMQILHFCAALCVCVVTRRSCVNKSACICMCTHVYLLYMQPCTNGLHQPNQHLPVF